MSFLSIVFCRQSLLGGDADWNFSSRPFHSAIETCTPLPPPQKKKNKKPSAIRKNVFSNLHLHGRRKNLKSINRFFQSLLLLKQTHYPDHQDKSGAAPSSWEPLYIKHNVARTPSGNSGFFALIDWRVEYGEFSCADRPDAARPGQSDQAEN